MDSHVVAIVGLGRVGTVFLEEMLHLTGKGIKVAYAAEINDTPGKAKAVAAGVKMVTVEELIAFGDKVDVIFDLTGSDAARKKLREQLAATNNRHTVLAPEVIARMMWALMSGKELPSIEGRKRGY
jgi:predicted dinucleotide-utilizing enzyme